MEKGDELNRKLPAGTYIHAIRERKAQKEKEKEVKGKRSERREECKERRVGVKS